jgi:uncharacterized protein
VNVISGFVGFRIATADKIAPKFLRLAGNLKLKNGAVLIAVLLAVSCGSKISACAAAGVAADAATRDQSIASIVARAQRGDPAAEARLGWMFSTGHGVPQNFYEAAKWLYRAATRGNGNAQFALGMLYNKGEGVPCDYVLSYLWLNLSAAQAVGADRDFKTSMRDAIASKMTPRQLLTAQQLALEWYKSQ